MGCVMDIKVLLVAVCALAMCDALPFNSYQDGNGLLMPFSTARFPSPADNRKAEDNDIYSYETYYFKQTVSTVVLNSFCN